MESQKIMLEANDLMCIRDDRVLFSELSFSLMRRQVLLLEGKNGSGKTSLLRILCGFREPDQGGVMWRGANINDSSFHANMAYVGHLDGVKKELNVFENLQMALALGQASEISIEQALEKVQLQGYDETPVQALSAGQKRRLSLARLLITQNILWILDEPFTSLDRQGIKLIEALMLEHVQRGGMIIMTSHHDIDLPTADIKRINLSACH